MHHAQIARGGYPAKQKFVHKFVENCFNVKSISVHDFLEHRLSEDSRTFYVWMLLLCFISIGVLVVDVFSRYV